MDEKVIEVKNFRKTYGSFVAVEGISFEVHRGEIFGLLGPNGAGKTSTLESLEGLRQPDGGTLNLLGVDPSCDLHKLVKLIGEATADGYVFRTDLRLRPDPASTQIAVSTAAENSTFTLKGMPAVAGLAGIGMLISIGTSILIFPLSMSSATPPARLTVSPFTPVR